MGFFTWPFVVLVLALVLVVGFGAISLTTSLYTAVSVAMILVGLALMFGPYANPPIGIALVIVGGAGMYLGDRLPNLTVGQGLSFLGVQP